MLWSRRTGWSTSFPATLRWGLLVAVLAVASMTIGNLAAYWQDDPRRLLGWSTVSQVGYLLVPVAVAGRSEMALPALLVYLAGYTVTNLAAFAVTTALPGRRDLGRRTVGWGGPGRGWQPRWWWRCSGWSGHLRRWCSPAS